jgi:oxaloacetate decarboxylase alpha subunit
VDNDKLDLDQIRAVVQIASEADISELEVESPALKISVKKSRRGSGRSTDDPPALTGAAGTVTEATRTSRGGAIESDTVPIVAPMVGTFYRAPTPGADPFVNEGDLVTPGQTVCIIEAMKLFNEIQSDLQGTIVRVLLENAVPVEYGQPLFLVRPTPSAPAS